LWPTHTERLLEYDDNPKRPGFPRVALGLLGALDLLSTSRTVRDAVLVRLVMFGGAPASHLKPRCDAVDRARGRSCRVCSARAGGQEAGEMPNASFRSATDRFVDENGEWEIVTHPWLDER